MFGGVGADVFVFDIGDGTDTIKDFNAGIDILSLKDASFEDLNIVQKGDHTEIYYGDDDRIILENTGVSELTQNDFWFS